MTAYWIIVGMATIFAVVFGIGQAFYWNYISNRQEEKDRLARRLGTVITEEDQASLFREAAADAAAGALGNFGGHLKDMLIESELNWSVGRFLMISFGIAGIVGVLGFILMSNYVGMGNAGLLIGAVAGAAPYFVVRQKAEARSKALLEQLPEALDLMARSLQAGLGLGDAFKMCAEELPLPLAGEFGRVFEEIRFGRDYRTALTRLMERNPRLFELRMFVSSVLLQRETGGNLIEVLTTISATIRARFLFQGKVRALTSEARFSALILGCLPISVFIILLVMNPGYMTPLFTDILGYYMLGAMVILYGTGGFIMYAISQVEV
ncbi:MAG: tight adherence protein B [Kiritimatiellia bacterium]|jgi:tight adherence protein B